MIQNNKLLAVSDIGIWQHSGLYIFGKNNEHKGKGSHILNMTQVFT